MVLLDIDELITYEKPLIGSIIDIIENQVQI